MKTLFHGLKSKADANKRQSFESLGPLAREFHRKKSKKIGEWEIRANKHPMLRSKPIMMVKTSSFGSLALILFTRQAFCEESCLFYSKENWSIKEWKDSSMKGQWELKYENRSNDEVNRAASDGHFRPETLASDKILISFANLIHWINNSNNFDLICYWEGFYVCFARYIKNLFTLSIKL